MENFNKDKDLRSLIVSALREVLNEKTNRQKRYLTKNEVADRCSVCLMTVNNWISRQLLNPHKIGGRVLFDSEEVDEAVQNGRLMKFQRRFQMEK